MQKVPPHGVTTRGLDVSHYDGSIDFGRVRASGRDFVFAKCTEYSADSTYSHNKAAAEAAGLLFGAYHFFHPSRDPLAQAENFLKNAQLKAGNLHAVLDWESSDSVAPNNDVARAKVWLNHVEQATGRAPIIYGGPYFLQALALDQSFKHYPLWVANYGVQTPSVPDPWSVWSFWQYSDRGDVPGIPAANEDLDIFNGPVDNLRKLTIA